jgi:hypothetical protein
MVLGPAACPVLLLCLLACCYNKLSTDSPPHVHLTFAGHHRMSIISLLCPCTPYRFSLDQRKLLQPQGVLVYSACQSRVFSDLNGMFPSFLHAHCTASVNTPNNGQHFPTFAAAASRLATGRRHGHDNSRIRRRRTKARIDASGR